MLKSSCAFFAQEILSGPIAPPYKGRFLVSEHHEEWDELIAKYKRLCILAPRDHGKTYFFDFAYPIWQCYRQPGSIGFILSATQPQAERILEDIKSEIESNPKLAHLIPERVGARWSSTYMRLANGSRIYARGFGTKVRGAHPDWIVVDDGLNDETIYSEMVRKKQADYFFTAISNMVVPTGQIIVVGTPFHADDLYGELRKNPEYAFRKYPAMRADGTALWPDRYSPERLDAKKREIGAIRFTREFMVDPISDDMSLFPRALFQGQPTEMLAVKLGAPADFWKKDLGLTLYMGVDIAISSSVSADYFVCFVMGLDKHGNRYVVDIERHHGMPYNVQLGVINRLGRLYEPALIFIESNQLQQVYGDELIRLTDLPIKKFQTTAVKNMIDKGVPSLRVLLENKKFRIPRGDARSIEVIDTWISEMNAITWAEGKLKSVSGHDDTVMACWICDQAIKLGGFGFTFGTEYEKLDDKGFKDLMAELTGESPKSGNGDDAPRVSLVDEDTAKRVAGIPDFAFL